MAFKKGDKKPSNSGRKEGVKNKDNEVKELAKQYTEDAIKRLAEWMQSDNGKASVAACNALLDRAWGKPAQQVDATLGGNLTITWQTS